MADHASDWMRDMPLSDPHRLLAWAGDGARRQQVLVVATGVTCTSHWRLNANIELRASVRKASGGPNQLTSRLLKSPLDPDGI
jgi:hypothetical protein